MKWDKKEIKIIQVQYSCNKESTSFHDQSYREIPTLRPSFIKRKNAEIIHEALCKNFEVQWKLESRIANC